MDSAPMVLPLAVFFIEVAAAEHRGVVVVVS